MQGGAKFRTKSVQGQKSSHFCPTHLPGPVRSTHTHTHLHTPADSKHNNPQKAGKWEIVMGPKYERGCNSLQPVHGTRSSKLAPGYSPAGGASPSRRVAGSPHSGGDKPGALSSSSGAPKSVLSGGGGLIAMILDMVYEHARQVGCASHRFRLSCSACEIGEHPAASVADLLQGACAARAPATTTSKGPTLLTRGDRLRAELGGGQPRLASDPEIGMSMKGLEDCVEDFDAPFSAASVKELLLSRLVDARDASDDQSKHYMVTLILEQMKRPTFQAHDAPKGRNTGVCVCARASVLCTCKCVRVCVCVL